MVEGEPSAEPHYTRFRINYVKDGAARLLSHLEVIDVFLRAFRRAGLNFRMTQGFHPQPRIVFASLYPWVWPVWTSILRCSWPKHHRPGTSAGRCPNNYRPGLLCVEWIAWTINPASCGLWEPGTAWRAHRTFSRSGVSNSPCPPITSGDQKKQKGFRKVDLKPLVNDINILTTRTVELNLMMGQEGTVRPRLAVEALFGLDSAWPRACKLSRPGPCWPVTPLWGNNNSVN